MQRDPRRVAKGPPKGCEVARRRGRRAVLLVRQAAVLNRVQVARNVRGLSAVCTVQALCKMVECSRLRACDGLSAVGRAWAGCEEHVLASPSDYAEELLVVASLDITV